VLDLSLTPDQERFGESWRTFCAEKLRPFAADSEAKREFGEELVAALGTWVALPGSDGFAGGTGDPLSLLLAAQGLGWADPCLGLAWVTGRQVSWLIAACGTEEQRRRYLPRLAAGPLPRASLLLFEGYGRGPSELHTTARRDGDGWTIDGDKIAVVAAGTADVSVVIARDDSGELIGFVVDDVPDAVEFDGAEDRRLAMSAAHLAHAARLRGLRVPAEAALNREGLAAAIGVCRLAQAAVSLGTAEAAIRYAADWGVNRKAFGRPLVGFQGVAFPLTNMMMEGDSALMSLIGALSQLKAGDAGETDTSRAVAQCNHLLRNAGREGVELMGVHGVITDHPQERIYRSAAELASIDFDPLLNPLVLSNS
jgi:alkylation response protein AidB-like acyl-CoA dehydrogenase